MADDDGTRIVDLQAQIAALLHDKAGSRARRVETIAELQKIVASLDKIVSSMKRLSINASIESARAGEAGMGFAVVAEEFRFLSREAQSAVDQASELLAARGRDRDVG